MQTDDFVLVSPTTISSSRPTCSRVIPDKYEDVPKLVKRETAPTPGYRHRAGSRDEAAHRRA